MVALFDRYAQNSRRMWYERGINVAHRWITDWDLGKTEKHLAFALILKCFVNLCVLLNTNQ